MAKVVYYVSADATGWRITYNGTDYRCGSEQAALEVAVEAAHGSGKLGYDAIVVVHEPDGGWKTRWGVRPLSLPVVCLALCSAGSCVTRLRRFCRRYF
jgi:hypothetical protein